MAASAVSWRAHAGRRYRAGSVGIALAAIVATLAAWFVFADQRVSAGTDFQAFYEPVARNLVDGRGWVALDGAPATRYPPGYPVIVAAVIGAARLGLITETVGFALVSIGSMCAACVCLWLIARSVWTDRTAWLPALLLATYPLLLWLSVQQSSELPFVAVFYAAVATFWLASQAERPRARRFVAAGLLIGAAMLIRPIAIGVWGVLLIALWAFRRDLSPGLRLRLSAALLAGVVVAVAPWQLWLWRHTGRLVVLSEGGAASVRDGLTFALTEKRFRDGVSVPDDVLALMTRLQAQYDSLTSVGITAGVMWDELVRSPSAVAKLVAIKAARSWYATDSHRRELAVAAVQALYLVLIVAGGVLAWRRGPAARQLTWLVAGLALYFWVMTIGVLSIARYTVPAMGLLFLLAAPLIDVRSRRQHLIARAG